MQELQTQSVSSVAAGKMLEKVIKGAEMAMQNSILLQQEIHKLCTLNRHQKEKMMTRPIIQDGGSLTGDEGLQRLREREKPEEPSSSRP